MCLLPACGFLSSGSYVCPREILSKYITRLTRRKKRQKTAVHVWDGVPNMLEDCFTFMEIVKELDLVEKAQLFEGTLSSGGILLGQLIPH